jgi:WD40 repeat protein
MQNGKITPSRTLVTSFSPKLTAASNLQSEDYFEEGDWVLCIGANPSSQWMSCALSNGEIQVYDKEKLLLLQTYHCPSFVTDVAIDHSNPNFFATSATDGSIVLYDVRQQPEAFKMKLPRNEEEALSLSLGFDGNITAIGSNKGKIHFCDMRNTRSMLGTYNNCHTAEVTRVRFQTIASFGGCLTSTPTLISASEDGLVCIFDTTQSCEESSLQNVLSVQSPIREVGFFGPQSETIYCLTGDETLKLYNKNNSTCHKDFGPHLRSYLSQQMQTYLGNSMCPIEYLVDTYWDATHHELLLLAGSANGDAGVFRVGEQDISLVNHLNGGHRGVVRGWTSLSSNIFVTAGEDARVCEWNRLTRQITKSKKATGIILSSNRSTTSVAPSTGGGKLRRPRSRMTHRPY